MSINHKQPNTLTFLLAAACVSRKTRREIITKHPKISLSLKYKKLSAIHVTYPNQVLTFYTGNWCMDIIWTIVSWPLWRLRMITRSPQIVKYSTQEQTFLETLSSSPPTLCLTNVKVNISQHWPLRNKWMLHG